MIRLVVRHWTCPAGGKTRAWDVTHSLDEPCPQVAAGGIGGSGRDQTGLMDDGLPEPPIMTTLTDKPPYRVPAMTEVRDVPWNGHTVASLFCGCGGSSTGYRLAGYRVLAACEFVPAAANSYAANKADYTTLLRQDVRELRPEDLLAACGLERGELDVLDGSPPCEPFSTAGRRDATWREIREYSGQQQRTDDLFYEYARLVDAVQPRAFVAENVTGLIKGRAKGYFRRIMAALRACGYDVQARVLDASWLGVPQARKRVIIIGVRSDLGRAPVFPAPLPYQFTVRDAIGDLLGNGMARMGSFELKRNPPIIDGAPAPTVVASDSSYWHVDDVEQVYKTKNFRDETRSVDEPALTVVARGPSAEGGSLQVRRDTGGNHQTQSHRDRTDEPCPTILGPKNRGHYAVEYDEQIVGNEAFEPTFGGLDAPHPTVMAEGARTSGELRSSVTRRRRPFTIAELRRICGFPDDYVLTGSFSQQWERLGDAVPPPMAAAWAGRLAALLDDAGA